MVSFWEFEEWRITREQECRPGAIVTACTFVTVGLLQHRSTDRKVKGQHGVILALSNASHWDRLKCDQVGICPLVITACSWALETINRGFQNSTVSFLILVKKPSISSLQIVRDSAHYKLSNWCMMWCWYVVPCMCVRLINYALLCFVISFCLLKWHLLKQ